MFKNQLKSVLIAGAVALGALSATATTANAGGHGGIYIDGPGFSVGFGDYGHRRHRWGHSRDWERPRFRRNRCNPRKAVRKARRKGIRHAHVVRAGRRGVIVAGRKWGDRVVIGFGRHRSCPVRYVRSR